MSEGGRVTNGQLTLLDIPSERVLTAKEAGLAATIPEGPAKFLTAIVKRGLHRQYLHTAASLVLALDETARDEYRPCVCGCGRSLKGRRANAKHFEGACRVKALRAREASTRSRPWGKAHVTVAEAPTASDDYARSAA
jgi:hypothetical protein